MLYLLFAVLMIIALILERFKWFRKFLDKGVEFMTKENAPDRRKTYQGAKKYMQADYNRERKYMQ